MRTRIMAAVALVAASLNVAHAEPPATRAEGFACRLAAVGGPDSVHTGVVAAGPVALADLPGVSSREGVEWGVGTPSQGQITCGIEVGYDLDLHPNQSAFVAQVSASGSSVVTLGPTQVSYTYPRYYVVALCTIWRLFSPATGWRTLYYNAPTGGFTDNPANAQCAVAEGPGESSGNGAGEEGGNSDPAVRVDAYGHIVITGSSSGISFTTSDRYADSFSCSITSYSPVTVTCTPNFPNAQNADAFYCEYFIITATTSSPAAKVHGVASCLGHTGAPLSGGDAETNDVSGSSGSDRQYAAGYYDENVDVTSVVCVARGINGAPTPTTDFQVDCYEPGLPAVVR